MEKQKAIELLKQGLYEIDHLRKLNYDNQSYKLWRDKIKDILDNSFGNKSIEYERFAGASVHVLPYYQKEYIEELEMRETALKSIIQKQEIIGFEDKPNEKEKEIVLESLIQIFDAMHFHPKVVEASKSCFIASNYREAILNAFIALTDYVKEKTKLKTDNKDLMAKAFDLEKPIIKLNSLTEQYERDEQEGFRFLYMGASVGIRNPKAHKLIPQTNPLHTLEYLAFASLLFRRIDESIISTH